MDYSVIKKEILHSAIGGGICFISMVFLTSFIRYINIQLEQLLVTLGILGVTAFEPYAIARAAIVFAPIYLLCGFLAGLYTGYLTEELKITLPITGGIGFIGFIVLLFFYGGLNLNNYLEFVVLPLLGNIVGAYLGGYTVIWPGEEEEEEEEGIRLELEQ